MTGKEEAGLLADIRENPDEVALRLIHADWLEEQARGSQADFVRAQCRLADLPRASPERLPLLREAQRLLRENWADWTRPFAALMGTMPNPVSVQFRHSERAIAAYPRGLRESLTVDARVFLQRGGELLALAPLRHLDLNDPAEAGPALGACRHLRWLETLLVTDRYRGPVDAATMAGLAASPHLGRLRELWLPHNSLGDRGAARLASASWLPQVRHLSLSDNGLATEGAEALAGASGFRPRILDLSLNEPGDAGLSALVRAGTLDGVADLRLIECRLGDLGAEALASRWSLAPESLYLRDNGISDRGAEALASAPWIDGVAFLDLSDNRVSPAGRDALARACRPDARLVA